MDRVKYHDLYLSAGYCSCAVNVILKPLYPLFEDLQYSRSHMSLPALKLHYQKPSSLCIIHKDSFHFIFCIYWEAILTEFKIMKQSAKCLNITTLRQWKYISVYLCLHKLILESHVHSKIILDNQRCHTSVHITAWCSLYWNTVNIGF